MSKLATTLSILCLSAVLSTSTSQAHVFSMSCKVNALNGAFATSEGRARAIAHFRKCHVTKLWLESYRHLEHVDVGRLREVSSAFRAAGFETCGMITPTQLNDSHQMVCCWTDPVACERLAAECAKAAGVFDCIIMDDFLFTSCTCARCAEAKTKSGAKDWGAFRRQLMMDVCRQHVIAAGRAVNPRVQFIVKYPCWYDGYANAGYDPVPETELFGACWIGTETRDANPNPLQACWIMDWMDRQTNGKCGGGWYDPLDSKPAKYVEQARYTILGGARESLLHCYDYLAADDPGTTPFGENMSGGHACSAAFLVEADGLKLLADTLDGATRGPFTLESNGVSRHAFTKDGVRYEAFQNTTGKTATVIPSFSGRKILSLPLEQSASLTCSGVSLLPHALILLRD